MQFVTKASASNSLSKCSRADEWIRRAQKNALLREYIFSFRAVRWIHSFFTRHGHFVFYDDDDKNADVRCLWPSYECRPLLFIDSGSRPSFSAPSALATKLSFFLGNI